jgi:hypothetical protein
MDILGTFFGILVLSFIVERFQEIFASIIDWLKCRDDKRIFSPVKEECTKNLATIKRLLFTPIGLIVSWWIVSTLTPDNVGILHVAFKNVTATATNTTMIRPASLDWMDTLLTTVAISWGTGPVHSFMDVLQKYGKS